LQNVFYKSAGQSRSVTCVVDEEVFYGTKVVFAIFFCSAMITFSSTVCTHWHMDCCKCCCCCYKWFYKAVQSLAKLYTTQLLYMICCRAYVIVVDSRNTVLLVVHRYAWTIYSCCQSHSTFQGYSKKYYVHM